MTKNHIESVLERARSWPKQDQEELAEAAREIEARRNSVYALTDEERAAIARARQSPLLSDADATAFWKSLGIE